jgi:thiamine-phosphate pyrophosphorylase
VIARDRPLLCFVHSTGPEGRGVGGHAARRLAEAGGDAWPAVDLVQVRGKDLPAADLEALATAWVEALASHPATRVLVNDRLDVALATGADGVHVGRDDLPPGEVRRLAPRGFLVGGSAHDRAELELAQRAEADYAGLGAFFPSRTKAGAGLLDAADPGWREPFPGLTIPVVAIGGITPERVAEVFAFPFVSGIAVSEAIQAARKPAEAIRDLRAAVDRAWHDRASGSSGR